MRAFPTVTLSSSTFLVRYSFCRYRSSEGVFIDIARKYRGWTEVRLSLVFYMFRIVCTLRLCSRLAPLLNHCCGMNVFHRMLPSFSYCSLITKVTIPISIPVHSGWAIFKQSLNPVKTTLSSGFSVPRPCKEKTSTVTNRKHNAN